MSSVNPCCVANYALCINQFATFEKIITWETLPACVPSGHTNVGATKQPVDLTGYTAELQIRPFSFSTNVLYDATPNITLGGPAGTITILIPASTTKTFTWWTGVYDLLLTDSSNFTTRLLSGTVSISPGVSM
jgi:hypothetical protein